MPVLFIRKSASNFEYLRQNLAILSAPTGAVVETRFRPRWIDPTVLHNMPKAGQPVCILFSDPPYEWQLPIRFAYLQDDPYMTEAGAYVFQFVLERFTDIPVGDPPDFRGRVSPEADWFVFRNDEDLVEPSYEPDDVAWRWVIQNIVGFFPERSSGEQPTRRLERYLSSFFFRSAGFKDDQDGLDVDPGATPLQIGHSYVQLIDCYAPHISPDRISQWELVGEAEPAVADVFPVLATADGLMGMRVVPRLPGAAKIKVWVQPEQARSTQLSIDCRVEGEGIPIDERVSEKTSAPHRGELAMLAPTGEGVAASGLSEAQTRALYFDLLTSYERAGLVVNDQERLELAGKLKLYAAEPRFLSEMQGVCLFRLGMFDRAWSVLSDLGLDRLREPEAVASYFVSGWSTGRISDIQQFVQRSDVSQWSGSLLKQVREVLPWVQVIGRTSLMEDLYLLGVLNGEVLFGVLVQYSEGDFVRDQVQSSVKAGFVRSDAAYRFLLLWLQQRQEQIRRRAVAGLAIDYGLSGGFVNAAELMDTYGERIVHESGIGQIERWREPIELIFAGVERLRFLERLADLARSLDSEQSDSYAVALYLEIARQYLSLREYSDGEDLAHAGRCIEQARGLLTSEPEMDRALAMLETQWLQRAERTDVIRDYLAQFEEHRINEIRPFVKGKRAVVIGGLKQEFDPNRLAQELGFKSVDHIEVWGHRSSLEPLTTRILSGQVDYVLDRVGFGPHRDEVKNSCRKAKQDGTPVHYITIYRSLNKRVVVEALWRCHFEVNE